MPASRPSRFVPVLAALCALTALPAVAAIDLDTPAGVLAANRKIQCSTVDGKPVTYYWHGHAFSRVPGEPDKRLFKVAGFNVRQCVATEDPARGKGYRLISREILLYMDPATGEILRTWENPWTGETVEVLHVANDPVNSANYVTGRDGKPITWQASSEGDAWWQTITVPLFYSNPLTAGYEKYIGGMYHATEMFNFMGSRSDLVDESKDTADIRVGWVRMSDWLPWMQMRGRAGLIYFHTAGTKLASWDDLPDFMKKEVTKNYPQYTTPPPADDQRPNETSWTYFKKKVEPESGVRH